MRRRQQKLARSRPRRNEYLSPNSLKNFDSSVCSGTGHEGEKNTVATPVHSQCSQRYGSQMEVCDVGWQSCSPISLTQVSRINGEDNYSEEREAAIKKLVENNVPNSPPFCNEPLLDLLADHRIEPERNKNNSQPLIRNENKGKKPGRAKDNKTSARSKNLLNKLDTIINEHEETEQYVEEEKATVKELMDLSVISQIGKPDTNQRVYRDSEPLKSQDIGDVNQSFDLFTSTQIAKQNIMKERRQLTTTNSDCAIADHKAHDISQTIKKCNGSPLVLNTALAIKVFGSKMSPKYTSSPLPPTMAEKKDQACDDLWTDEEMFDDDSFVRKATQSDLFVTPKAQKRRNTESTPVSKTKVAKYIHNSDMLFARVGASKESLSTDCLKIQQIEDQGSAERVPFQSYAQDRSQLNIVPKGTNSFFQHQTNNDKENITSTAASQKSGLQCSSTHTVQQMKCASISKSHSSHPMRCTTGKTIVEPQQPRGRYGAPYSSQAHPPTSNSLTKGQCDTVELNGANSKKPLTKPLKMNGDSLKGVIQKNIPPSNISQHYSTGRWNGPGLQSKIESHGTHASTSSMAQKPSLLSKSSHVSNNKSYEFVSRPVAVKKPKLKCEIKMKEGSSKTPPRTVTLKPMRESPNQLDTSLTADLLETLAQPDEILDSQVERNSLGSPMPLDPEADDDLDDMLLKAGDEFDAFGEEERACAGMNVERKTSVAKANDSFPSDDDALDEPQLLALLEEAETQNSQILNDKSTESSNQINKSAPCGKMSKLTLETKPASGECEQKDHTTNIGNKNIKTVNCVGNKNSATHFKFRDLKKEVKHVRTVQNNRIQAEETTSAAVDPINLNFCKEQLRTSPTRKPSVNTLPQCFHETAEVETASCISMAKAINTQQRSNYASVPNHQINGSFTKVKQNVTASQKCSPEEIERKKREALVRKQNRLKLKK